MGRICQGILILAVVVFWPALYESWETPKAAVVRIAGFGLLAGVLATPGWTRRVRWQAADVAAGAWLVAEILATAFSRAPVLSVFGDAMQHDGLITSIALAGIYLGVRVALDSRRDVDRLLHAWLAAAVVASLYAFVQVLGPDPGPWSKTATLGGVLRPFGTLGHPNTLGITTAAAGTAALALALRGGSRSWIYATAGAILALATLLTFSRAAWLGLAGGALLVVFLAFASRRKVAVSRRGLLIGAAALLVVLIALAVSPYGRALAMRIRELAHPASGSGLPRFLIWNTAWAAWLERPLLGHGPDTFALAFTRLQPATFWRYEWNHIPWDAHSLLFHQLATRGILGLLAGVFGIAALVVAARRAWRERGPAMAPLAGAIVAIFLAGSTGVLGITGATTLAMLAAVMVGFSGAAVTAPEAAPEAAPARRGARRRRERSKDRTRIAPGTWAAAGLAVAVMLSITVLETAALLAAGNARRWLALTPGGGPDDAIICDGLIADCRAAAAGVGWDDTAPRVLSDLLVRRAILGDADPRPFLRDAEAAAREAVRRQPLRASNHQALAGALATQVILGDRGRIRECEAAWDRAAALAPHDAFLLLRWARTRLESGRPDLALETARKLSRLYPERGMAHVALGEVRLALGERDSARADFQRALAAAWDPSDDGRPQAERALDTLGVAP